MLKLKLRRSWPAVKKNAGFSLIELILAVVILAVIVTPIMHSFVTSSNTSAKGQKLGEATDAASNILEALNSTSITNFTTYCTNGTGTVDMPSLLSMGGDRVTLASDAGNSNSANIDKLYYVTGIKTGSSKFDARVTVTPGVPSTETTVSPTNGFYELNANEIAKYIDPDETFVQPYADDANPDFIYYNSATNKGSGTFNQYYAKSGNRTFKSVQRTITIDVSQSASKVYAYITYNYLFTYDKSVKEEGHVVISRKYAIFPGGQARYEDDSTPVTAYIMYYPFYTQEDTGHNDGRANTTLDMYARNSDGINIRFQGKTDRIEINNKSDVALKLYLVKQRALAKSYTMEGGVPVAEVDGDGKYIYKRMALDGSEDRDQNDDGVEEIIEDKFGKYRFVNEYETNYRTTITEVRSVDYQSGYQNQIYANSAFNIATGEKIIGTAPDYYQVITNPLVAENCSDKISGSLVNTEQVDRIFYVSVELFKAGSFKNGQIDDSAELIYKLSGSALK